MRLWSRPKISFALRSVRGHLVCQALSIIYESCLFYVSVPSPKSAPGIIFVSDFPHRASLLFFVSSELLAEAIGFVTRELKHSPCFSSPLRLATHASASGRLDRDRALLLLNKAVLSRWVDFLVLVVYFLLFLFCERLADLCPFAPLFLPQENPDGRVRVALLATVSGPGGGKSFFIDEWFNLNDADIQALAADIEPSLKPQFELFRQSLCSAIRLPISLNDRMPLLYDGFYGPAYSDETLIAVRALFSYHSFFGAHFSGIFFFFSSFQLCAPSGVLSGGSMGSVCDFYEIVRSLRPYVVSDDRNHRSTSSSEKCDSSDVPYARSLWNGRNT